LEYAAVDWSVVNLPEDSSPNHPTVKTALARAALIPFTASGYGAATELRNLAQELGKYVEGETDRLAVRSWTPPLATGSDAGE
jgi:hypothetical protein